MVSKGGPGNRPAEGLLRNLFSQKFCPLEPETRVVAQNSFVSPGNKHSQGWDCPWLVLNRWVPAQANWMPDKQLSAPAAWNSQMGSDQAGEEENWVNEQSLLNLLMGNNSFQASKQKRYVWEDDCKMWNNPLFLFKFPEVWKLPLSNHGELHGFRMKLGP